MTPSRVYYLCKVLVVGRVPSPGGRCPKLFSILSILFILSQFPALLLPKTLSRVGRRRKMFRPMASSIYVLSDIVANGHQTIH